MSALLLISLSAHAVPSAVPCAPLPAQPVLPGGGALHAVDADGDGDVDLISAYAHGSSQYGRVTVQRNLGGGVFGAERVIHSRSMQLMSALVADVDADGDADLAVSYITPPDGYCYGASERAFLYHNLGTTLDGGTRLNTTSWGDSGRFAALRAADLDGDGQVELLGAGLSDAEYCWQGGLYQWTNDGVREGWIDTTDQGVVDVQPADIDGDGDLDLVALRGDWPWYGGPAAALVVYPNLGGLFGTPVVHRAPVDDPQAVVTGDFDADGDVDVLTASAGRLAWHANDGTGTLGPAQLFDTPTAPRSLAVGDLDLDGDPDLVVGGGGTRVYENLGGSWAAPRFLDADGHSVQIADLDGDGWDDIAAGTVSVWGVGSGIRWYRNNLDCLAP